MVMINQASTKYSLTADDTPVSIYKYQKSTTTGSVYYHMDVARFLSDDATPKFIVTLTHGTVIDIVS